MEKLKDWEIRFKSNHERVMKLLQQLQEDPDSITELKSEFEQIIEEREKLNKELEEIIM